MTDPSLLRQELCELLKKAQDSEYNQNITTGIILYKQAKEIAQTLYEDETSNLQLKKLYESKVKDITNKINQITEISEKEHHSVGKNGVLLIDYTFNSLFAFIILYLFSNFINHYNHNGYYIFHK